jgi:hypothetical protein
MISKLSTNTSLESRPCSCGEIQIVADLWRCGVR